MSRLQDRRQARDGLKVRGSSRPSLVATVDLGASKIGCFIMKPDGVQMGGPDGDQRTIQVAGVAHVRSRGIRGGTIVNMEEAAQAIAQAVERAETMAGVSVSGVTVTTAGGQLASHRVSAAVSLGARPISDQDLQRGLQMALAQARFAGRRAIHLLPIAWSVDNARGVRDPRDMFGRQLGLELLVVTMNESGVANLSQCLERAHLKLEGVVAAPFASALAALEDDEMDLGCICIDMGGGSTSTAVFAGGSLVHVDSLAVGGAHVTADVARGLSTTLVGAERIKTLHGSAIASANEDRETIEAPPRGDDPGAGPVIAPRSLLKGVIAPRVEETLELLRERLKASGAPIDPGAGIVLTGGASQLTGVRELAVRVFDRPVRLGKPRRAPHLAEAASGPAFCAAAGVLHRAAFGPREAGAGRAMASIRTAPRDPADPRAGMLTRAAGWLRENL
ncbi:MAG TPA: cell division protein FtsA [Caulobacteraceae bacterium]|jgi:cell division protein FtsA|nr:cell division protein FtsA [Caulobacteraceae bacterium]